MTVNLKKAVLDRYPIENRSIVFNLQELLLATYFAEAKRFATSAQFTTFHQFAIYSARRF
jgi:hypothetical protein